MSVFLNQIDEAVFHFINSTLANPLGDLIFPLFNSGYSFLPLGLLVLIGLGFQNSRRLWTLFILVVLGILINDWLIFSSLKEWIARPRPAVSLEWVRSLASGAEGGFSFPSSHTANSFLTATILALVFRGWKWLFLGFAFLIGLARIYVGVHFPSDVLGSALLGSLMGWLWLRGIQKGWEKFFPNQPWPLLDESKEFSNPEGSRSKALLFDHPAFPWGCLGFAQILRLLWAWKTQLTVPPDCAWLWCVSETNTSASGLIPIAGKIWFGLFGSHALSLWAIPWFLQTLWLSILTWMAWRKGGMKSVWILTLAIIFLPLVSQLSFLGSPAQALGESDYPISIITQAFVFYGLLGLPLWIFAVRFLSSHPISSVLTLSGWILGSCQPQMSWHMVLLMGSGTLLAASHSLPQKKVLPTSGWARFILVLGMIYGLTMNLSVYNPRFLRKLNVSFLPRNSPQYVQMGWTEWIQRIKPKLTDSKLTTVWADSEISQYQIQYLLGNRFHVFNAAVGVKIIKPGEEVYYIREVYLAQINPRVIFLSRGDWRFFRNHFALTEMDSTETRLKGDPIRQFQLYRLQPKSEMTNSGQ